MPLTKRRLAGASSLELTTLGLGGAAFGGLYSGVTREDAVHTLQAALAAGINYFDTAPYYGFGRSERVMGDVLREQHQPFVLSSKVGRLLKAGAVDNPAAYGWPEGLPFTPVFDYSYDAMMRSFEDSLQRLGLAQIDILYIHDIGAATHGAEHEAHFKTAMHSGYKALDELRSAGLIKAFGLGVNEWQVCKAVLDYGQWDVFLLAGRYTLLEQEAADKLFPACQKTNTSIVIGGPFNSGILVGGDTWNYGKAPHEIIAKVEQLKALCQDYQVALPAAALQFPLAHECVVSVIPGVRHPHELAQILDWTQQTIPAEFWAALKQQGLLAEQVPTPQHNLYGSV